MKRIFYDIDQNSPEWFELRKGLITASVFTKFWMGEKTSGYKEAIADVAFSRNGFEFDHFAGNNITDKGHEQEPLMRMQYEINTLTEVSNGGFFKYGEWCGASPDACIGDDGLWENKAKVKSNTLLESLEHFDSGIKLTEKSNKAHFWQVYFQLYVTGRKWCDYQYGNIGLRPMIERIYMSEGMTKRIEEKLNMVIPEIEKAIILINKYKE